MTMKPRFGTLRQLVELRAEIRAFPDSTDTIIRDALIANLPPTHSRIFQWFCSHGGNEPSSFVSAGWNMAHNQAADILRELYEFGLLEREEVRDENGKRFIYKVIVTDLLK